MKLNPTQSAAVHHEEAGLKAAIQAVLDAPDLAAKRHLLGRLMDKTISASLTMRAVEDEVRGQALKKLETV